MLQVRLDPRGTLISISGCGSMTVTPAELVNRMPGFQGQPKLHGSLKLCRSWRDTHRALRHMLANLVMPASDSIDGNRPPRRREFAASGPVTFDVQSSDCDVTLSAKSDLSLRVGLWIWRRRATHSKLRIQLVL